MSLFQLGRLTPPAAAGPVSPASDGTAPPAVSPVGDPSQTGAQHSSTGVSSGTVRITNAHPVSTVNGNNPHAATAAQIAVADSLLEELDGTRARGVRSLPSAAPDRSRVPANPNREHVPAPPGVPQPDLSLVPANVYVAGYSDNGKPILRERNTNKLVKGSGALPGAGKGRAPGLAKMVRDIVHIPGIIQFLQDVAIGKLAAGTKMADRIKAAEIILDRGYGKPSQHVEIKDDTAQSEARKQVEKMTTEKLSATVDQLRALIARKDEVITDAEIVDE